MSAKTACDVNVGQVKKKAGNSKRSFSRRLGAEIMVVCAATNPERTSNLSSEVASCGYNLIIILFSRRIHNSKTDFNDINFLAFSLRSGRYCVGAILKFWRQSRVPKKGSRDEAGGFAARDGSAGQIALDYITTAPPPNLTRLLHNTTSYAGYLALYWKCACVGPIFCKMHSQNVFI